MLRYQVYDGENLRAPEFKTDSKASAQAYTTGRNLSETVTSFFMLDRESDHMAVYPDALGLATEGHSLILELEQELIDLETSSEREIADLEDTIAGLNSEIEDLNEQIVTQGEQ